MRSSSRSPFSSNRQTATFVAWAENRAKFVPLPSQVAPPGNGAPSRILILFEFPMLCSLPDRRARLPPLRFGFVHERWLSKLGSRRARSNQTRAPLIIGVFHIVVPIRQECL